MASPSIFIPLYIYPSKGAWQPLLEAASKYPEASFVAVINPNSGPGKTPLPDNNYISAILELRKLSNIRLLGYVHCQYGHRGTEEIASEVATYAAWPKSSTNSDHATPFSIDGIFFDEAPSDLSHLGFMTTIARHARAQWNANSGKLATIVYNPGVVVSRVFYDGADHIVAFENNEDSLPGVLEAGLSQIPRVALRKTIVLIHTCKRSGPQLADLLSPIATAGLGGLFVTDQAGGGYSRWPSEWQETVDLVALLNTNTRSGV